MRTLLQELHFAVRVLRKRPALTLVAALTLGLGIGLAATMFSVVNGSIWRGLPAPRPDRVVHLERTFTGQAADPAVPPRDFLDWRAQQTSFTDLAAFHTTPVNAGGTSGRPKRYSAAYITANAFDVLGVRPVLGRTFVATDDQSGAGLVAIVSYAVWRDHFDRASNLNGLTMRLDGESVSVVGVMPEGFRFPLNEDIWLLLRPNPTAARDQGPALQVLGRLRDGASLADAQAEMSAIAERLARTYPALNEGTGVVVQAYIVRWLGDQVVTLFYTMLVAAIGVLAIACVNVANLLLATASLRVREMAIRAALGASRARAAAQLLLEVSVLSALGGLTGLVLARIGVRIFNEAVAGTNPPFWLDIRLDGSTTLFVALLVGLVSLAAGLVPAVRASGARAVDILKDESRGGTGWRVGRITQGLVIAQVALSGALLVGAGLLVRSALNVRAVDFGFSTDRLLSGNLALPPSTYPDEDRQRLFWDQLLARLAQQPGVRSVTLTTNLPGLGSRRVTAAIEGRAYPTSRDVPRVRGIIIAPGFFEAFGVALSEGRDFGTGETRTTQPVALVNRAFARRFLPGDRAVGRRLRVRAGSQEADVTVVGVAPDMRIGGVRNLDPEAIYLSHAQWSAPNMFLVVHAHGDAASLATPVRDAVATLDPDLPVEALQTMDAALDRSTWFYGTFGTVFVVFGAAALALAVIGLYGLMAFSVTQRTREMGVRMAMGAQPLDLLRDVFAQALWQLVIGLAGGLVIAAIGSRLLMAFLVGVTPRDPAVYVLIVLALLLCGLGAAAGPALRAARTRPADALRHD